MGCGRLLRGLRAPEKIKHPEKVQWLQDLKEEAGLHHHCTTTASPLHHHCTTTAPPLHLSCTSTAPPLHLHCTSTAPPPRRHSGSYVQHNPESLDSSIQGALSALFPPFEATAPVVLSQLFRTIEERYHGDALQCLLDFLIPSKHLLESVQQAACAGYSDVVFRCEGWPLCLRDQTVVQLAPVNPLLLRPGDFYLQVEPFGDQAARVVLKSLLEEGRREVEETPVPETSYPCIFTEEWLRDVNEGRRGTPLSRCLLCTDQGVVKLPWAKIAIPEFLDKPKITPAYREAPPELKQVLVPSLFNSSTLPMEA
ncbi:uncharacterized protein KIAA1755-like, partial [Clinocottus analis]|uniref:uncharacterized protein KIAA1755-like n=1 Tax=Clinocottus analis TaxID=304258 RepID=UPI0035C213F9